MGGGENTVTLDHFMNIIKDKLLLVDDDEYVHCPCPYGGGERIKFKMV